MTKEHLRITISNKKAKTKFGAWWYKNISWPCHMKATKLKAWFYGGLYDFFYKHSSPEKQKEMDEYAEGVYSSVEISLSNESGMSVEEIKEIISNIQKDEHKRRNR